MRSLTFLSPSWDQQSLGLRHLQVSFHHMSRQMLLLQHLPQLHLHLRHPHQGSDPQKKHWNTRCWTNYPIFPPQMPFPDLCLSVLVIHRCFFLPIADFSVPAFLLALAIFMMPAYILTAIFPQREWPGSTAKKLCMPKSKGMAHHSQT